MTDANHYSTAVNESLSPFAIRATAIASLGGVLFGYDLGVISGALPSLTFSFNLTSEEVESAVAFLYIGSIIGSIVGGYTCDKFGRKRAIILTDAVFLLGSIVLAGAPTYGAVLLGRILVGVAVSVSAIADVAYLTEISSEGHRGALVSCNEVCITLGFLLAYGTSYGITTAIDFKEGWRIMFGLSGIIAVIQACGMMAMPESPVWLDKMGRVEEAKIAWSAVRGGEEVAEEDYCYDKDDHANGNAVSHGSIGQSDADAWSNNNSGGNEGEDYRPPSYDELYQRGKVPLREDDNEFLNPSTANNHSSYVETVSTAQIFRIHYREAIIAAFLAIAQQLCGHINILNFAPEIFAQIFYGSAYRQSFGDDAENMEQQQQQQNEEEESVDHAKLIAPTILLGAIKFLVIIFVIKKVDVYGRRKLLLCGVGLITVSLFLLGAIFAMNDEADSDEQTSFDSTTQALAIIGCVGVVSGYSLSYGPLTWLITSELFPTHVRGRALGASTILSSAGAVLASYTFLSAQSMLGRAVPFFLYFVISLGSLIFEYKAVPDTANCNADNSGDGRGVDEMLNQMSFWRNHGGNCIRCCGWCCGAGGGGTDTISEVQMEHCITRQNNGEDGDGDGEDRAAIL